MKITQWREEREVRSDFGSGVRPARERPCRRRSRVLLIPFVLLRSLFVDLSSTALSEL